MRCRLGTCRWLALGWLAAAQGLAAAVGVRSLPPVQISTDELGARHVESWLAVDPRDPQKLVAASLVFGERSGVAVYASRDGGRSWRRAVHGPQRDRYFPGLDPAVSFAADGDAFLCTTADALSVWRSTDGGETWGAPTAVPGGSYDRPFLVSDNSHGPYRGRLYVAGKFPITVLGTPGADVMAISRSDDRAASFRFPRLILPPPASQVLHLVGNPITTAEGRLIVPYQTFAWPKPAGPLYRGDHWIIASDDGGRSFSEPRHVATFQTYGHPDEWRSMKGLSTAPIALDTSAGPRRGRLYLAWLDAAGGRYQVFVAASADGGRTWSAPVRVNDDRTASNASNPALAVNEAGVVGVVWNDRRHDATDSCYQPFFAASLDGGGSFLPNLEIAKELTCPNGPRYPEGDFDAGNPAHSFVNGGDTQGIVALPGGSFHLAWIGGPGVLQLWSTVVVIERDRKP